MKRPEKPRYQTLLSVDGGGIRGIIPTIVLRKLENSIKDHIFENKDTLVPLDHRNVIKSQSDFDVDLTDYFDLVAGTSIGSWIACYVASRGKGSDVLFQEFTKNYGDKYSNLRVGGMEAVSAVFRELGPSVFKKGWFSSVTQLFRPKYSSDGMVGALKKIFGDTTLQDCETGCLITSYDTLRYVATSFLRSNMDKTPLTIRSTVRTEPREENRLPWMDQKWTPDLDILKDTNYYLRDIAQGSSSAPTYFAQHELRPINVDEPRMILIDGGVVANNPTLQAVTYAPHAFKTDIRNVAIFSVGCGVTDNMAVADDSPGAAYWLTTGGILDILMNGTSEYVQAMMDYWIYGYLKLPWGQYVRIQIKAQPNSEESKVISHLDDISKINDLEILGNKLADDNSESIRAFVRNYLLPVS